MKFHDWSLPSSAYEKRTNAVSLVPRFGRRSKSSVHRLSDKTILRLLYAVSAMSLTPKQLGNIQGDIWSKGFPKYYEIYYFFLISDAKLFSKCLPGLTAHSAQSPSLISTLEMVRGDQAKIPRKRAEVAKVQGIPEQHVDLPQNKISMSNALIAFSSEGLQVVSLPEFD